MMVIIIIIIIIKIITALIHRFKQSRYCTLIKKDRKTKVMEVYVYTCWQKMHLQIFLFNIHFKINKIIMNILIIINK